MDRRRVAVHPSTVLRANGWHPSRFTPSFTLRLCSGRTAGTSLALRRRSPIDCAQGERLASLSFYAVVHPSTMLRANGWHLSRFTPSFTHRLCSGRTAGTSLALRRRSPIDCAQGERLAPHSLYAVVHPSTMLRANGWRLSRFTPSFTLRLCSGRTAGTSLALRRRSPFEYAQGERLASLSLYAVVHPSTVLRANG